jgi:xylono-1,5-lactonase
MGVSGMRIECVAPAAAQLGEGALWDPDRGVVWWVDIRSCAIHSHRVATGDNGTQSLGLRVTSLGLARDGCLVASADPGFVRLHVADDLSVSVVQVIAPIVEPAGNRFNDGKVDSRGRFWAGTMDDSESTARGSLYRLDPSGAVTVIRSGFQVPNGPCFLADGTLLITDTPAREITAITLDAHGQPLAERAFARFGVSEGYPDGMTVDAEDHVWVAFWDGWCVRRLSPSGSVVMQVALPVQRPTCPSFAGDALGRMYVTTARMGLTAADLQSQPLAGGLLMLEPPVRGRPPSRFLG